MRGGAVLQRWVVVAGWGTSVSDSGEGWRGEGVRGGRQSSSRLVTGTAAETLYKKILAYRPPSIIFVSDLDRKI